MKRYKRAAAIVGAVVLLAVFCLPMVFAFGAEEGSMAGFWVTLGAAFFVPVMAYVFMMTYRVFGKKKQEEHPVENVIFDVGNVLVSFDPEPYLKSFGLPPEKHARVHAALYESGIWDERDRGLYDEEEYIRQFVALDPEDEEVIREILRRSPESVSPRPYAKTWVKYLKSRGYHLYLLSNYSTYMLEQYRHEMEFLQYMDGAVFSCEVKAIKPEAEIYEKLLTMYGLDPERSVFIDDREENCAAAEKFGMHTVCFRDFRQAAGELEKLGVG